MRLPWDRQEELEPNIYQFALSAGDVAVLCSDGLDNLTTERILEIASKTEKDKLARALADEAYRVGQGQDEELKFRADPDDITVVTFAA